MSWWVIGFSPNVTPGTLDYNWNALHGSLSKDTNPYLREFLRKSQKTTNG